MGRPKILLNLRHTIVWIHSEVIHIFTDNISAGGLLVLAFIIRPVVSSSVPTSFIRNWMKQAYMTLSDLILTHLFMPCLPLKNILLLGIPFATYLLMKIYPYNDHCLYHAYGNMPTTIYIYIYIYNLTALKSNLSYCNRKSKWSDWLFTRFY